VNQDAYDYQDKYAGRCLSSIQESLYYFLHNGTRLLLELIPHFIEKLYQLYHLVESLRGYRLYGSSLLVIYDSKGETAIDVRLIDFANCVTRMEFRDNINIMTCPPKLPMEPDHGYLLGIQSIIQALENIIYDSK
jgi:hypothetical protein